MANLAVCTYQNKGRSFFLLLLSEKQVETSTIFKSLLKLLKLKCMLRVTEFGSSAQMFDTRHYQMVQMFDGRGLAYLCIDSG